MQRACGRESASRSTGPIVQLEAAIAEDDGKDQARVADIVRTPLPPAAALTDVTIWHPDKMESAGDGNAVAYVSAESASDPPRDWREREFTAITVLDGRTFSSGGLTLRLADLELPSPDQVCRTLDNRLEQCSARAATQLELVTRARTLACRYQMTTSSEAVGSCRIGSLDLAERMVRTGYVRNAGGSKDKIATASGVGSPRR